MKTEKFILRKSYFSITQLNKKILFKKFILIILINHFYKILIQGLISK